MKTFFEIRENMAMKMKLINKMKKASPAAKKALEAPSRVDPKKKQNEMSDMEKTRQMAATAGLKTKSPEQKRREREQQAKNRMNRPNPEMLGNSTHTEKNLDEISVKDVTNQVMMKTQADAARKRRGRNVDQLKTSLDKLKKGLKTSMAPVQTPIKTRLNSQTEEVNLDEAFNLEVGAKVAMKRKGKMIYGKVIGKEKVMGKPGVEVKWSSGIKGRFSNDKFASLSMDRKADYIISEAVTEEKDPALKRAGVSGFNKPKRTPGHKSSSHIVVTKINGKPKTIRFGQQGASTAGDPKEGESDKMKAKRKSFKARHAKNIAKGKSSAAYWADKEKW